MKINGMAVAFALIAVFGLCFAVFLGVTEINENVQECEMVCEKNGLDYVYYEFSGSHYKCYCADTNDNLVEKLVRVR